MLEDEKLLSAFRKTDSRGQTAVLAYAISMSEDWPLEFAGAISLPTGELDDLKSPPVVSAPKKVK